MTLLVSLTVKSRTVAGELAALPRIGNESRPMKCSFPIRLMVQTH